MALIYGKEHESRRGVGGGGQESLSVWLIFQWGYRGSKTNAKSKSCQVQITPCFTWNRIDL